jgi:hypothetical protein
MNSTAPAAAVYVPPYLTVSPDDHRANLWVVTLLCLSLTNLALLARAMVKLRFDLRLAADDYSILASYVSFPPSKTPRHPKKAWFLSLAFHLTKLMK